ncbi:hypothetical protein M569_03995 [Genlisea aurea]|uniref:Prolamin-like domain-containing protein n=1 Tax=Genlisea aurea TaxID=192259 RepID=S8EDW4_9LAMI|nr:hypothetical protein M569_03995 [Genlisea aurea]
MASYVAIVLLLSLVASSAMGTSRIPRSRVSTLRARLRVEEEGPSSCWDALFELKSCSGEVVLFFLNGETTLGPSCCNAIRVIEHECWPSMMQSLGITAEEGDILRGYCDAAAVNRGGSTVGGPPPHHECPGLVH